MRRLAEYAGMLMVAGVTLGCSASAAVCFSMGLADFRVASLKDQKALAYVAFGMILSALALSLYGGMRTSLLKRRSVYHRNPAPRGFVLATFICFLSAVLVGVLAVAKNQTSFFVPLMAILPAAFSGWRTFNPVQSA